MKKLFLILAILICSASVSYCRTAKENMDDSLGHAYKAATEKKLDEAKDFFKKAQQYAKETDSWQGLIDSGYGLSTLNLPKEAKSAFDNGSAIIAKQRDWHGAVAIGYAYASLPKDMGTIDSAVKMWNNAKEWAKEKEDWCGLIEAGRGLLSVSRNSDAEECFDLAKNIVKEFPTEKGIKVLVQVYRKLGREDKAAECAGFQIQTETQGPPPGWVPTVGESIRGTKTVPESVQMAQRESIDRDIERKQQFEEAEAQRKHEEKMQRQEIAYQAYRDYLNYYSYPYYGTYVGFIANYDDYYIGAWTTQPVWAPRTYDEIYNWGLWNCGRYSYVNGFYIAIDID